MNSVQHGFADELMKTAFVGKALFNIVKKRPMQSLMAGGVLASTGLAAYEGYKSGRRGGSRGRYLQASKRGPSRAAYTNYHQLFGHKPTAKQKRRLSRNYKEKAFKR